MRLVLIATVLVVTGCGNVDLAKGSKDGAKDDPAAIAAPPNDPAKTPSQPISLAVADDASVPACESANKNQLIYVTGSAKFETCTANGWIEITVTAGKDGKDGTAGKDGAAGKDGVDGKDGSANTILKNFNCMGVGLTSQGGQDFSGFKFDYEVVLLTSGDIYANAVIRGSSLGPSNSEFYSANQQGAKNGGVAIIDDVYGSSDGGFWQFTMDRSDPTKPQAKVVYTDFGLPGGSTRTWNFSSPQCVTLIW